MFNYVINSTSNAQIMYNSIDSLYTELEINTWVIKELLTYLTKADNATVKKKLSDRISPLDIDDGLSYYYLNVLISYRQISELKDIVYESYKNFNEDELSARKDIIDLIGNLDCLINEHNEVDGKK